MERRPKEKMEDAINCSLTKEFTQIPNEVLRSAEMSAVAKTILGILLSNSEGWKTHTTVILHRMKEGKQSIRKGLKELEAEGYLLRLRYRKKETKEFGGTLWAYTDVVHSFPLTDSIRKLAKHGFEIINSDSGKLNRGPESLTTGLPTVGEAAVGNGHLRILKEKKRKRKDKTLLCDSTNNGNSSNRIKESDFDKFWELYPRERKGSKGNTIKSWNSICKRKDKKTIPSWQRIRQAILHQMKSDQWQDNSMIPQPKTWLNQSRWLDDPKDLKDWTKTYEKKTTLRNGHTDGIQNKFAEAEKNKT